MTLTKKQIAEAVQHSAGLSSKKAYQCVDAILEVLKGTLASGEDILFSGFGKFKVNEKSARKGQNPQTGESLIIEPRKVVKFYASSKLKERLNG